MKLSTLKRAAAKQTEEESVSVEAVEQQWNPWQPQKGPQTQAFYSEADETLFGGACGGGKSAILLILATTAHKHSVIFRREYPRLKDLIKKSKTLLGSVSSYNSNDKIWRDIPGDRTLEFGAVQYPDSVEAWRGVEHDLKAFDELTEFTQEMYRFLITWNRSSVPGQRSRVVATCNPPSNRDGVWIQDYWGAWLKEDHPNRAAPGELRWYISINGEDIEVDGPQPVEHDGEMLIPRSRTFIPANLEDNAFLRNTNYKSVLQALPEPLRSQLLKGKWLDFEVEDPWQVIPTAWVKMAQARWTPNPQLHRQTHLGVDVSRGGADKTVIASRHGNWLDELHIYQGVDTNDGDKVADLILSHRRTSNSEIRIDVVGVGSSPYDSIKRMRLRPVYPLSAGKRSERTDKSGMLRFVNLRSEWYWHLRELLDPNNGHGIALPPNKDLLADLTAHRWHRTLRDEIAVEPKDEVKKRLGRSPDCFVAGTLVLTTKGYKPIEKITTSDWVVTPYGDRRVLKLWTSLTDSLTEVCFSNGTSLTGKGKHTIFTWNNGWIRLDALSLTNEIETDNVWRLLKWRILNLLNTEGRSIGFKQQVGIIWDSNTMEKAIRRKYFFTEESGRILMVRFPLVATFITLMGIGRIIQLKTWKCCLEANIKAITLNNFGKRKNIGVQVLNIWKKSDHWQVNGTDPRQASNGIGNTASELGRIGKRLIANALFAVKSSWLTKKTRFTVLPDAQAEILDNELSKQKVFASSVKPNSLTTLIRNNAVVPRRVQTNFVPQGVEVYNLMVELDNVYYANGVLVSNCSDATVFAFAELDTNSTDWLNKL